MTPEANMERVNISPSITYGHPASVAEDKSIDASERLRILKRWEQEARDLQRASDENMTGGEPSMLPEVRKAIDRICREHGLDEKKVSEQ
jgi:hypothetical protein